MVFIKYGMLPSIASRKTKTGQLLYIKMKSQANNSGTFDKNDTPNFLRSIVFDQPISCC